MWEKLGRHCGDRKKWTGVDLRFYLVQDIIMSPFLPGGWENVRHGGRQVPLREQEVTK